MKDSMHPDQDDLLTVGVIGCGTIVRNIHLPVLLSLPGINVAWLTDQDISKAQALSAASGVDALPLPGQLNHLLKTDILLIAIPNGGRPPYLDLIREGLMRCAYVEKPFARSMREHDLLTRGLEAWQVAVGFDRRAFGITRLARETVDEQIFGLLRAVRFEFGGLGRILTGGGYLGNAQLAGGGILYQMGVHYIDSILFITNARCVALESGVMEVEDELDIHTEADLVLMLEDGHRVPLHILATTLKRANNRIELEFDRATISFTPAYGDPRLEVSTRSAGIVGHLHPTPEHGPLTPYASYAAHWRRVFIAIAQRKQNETSATACRLTTKTLEALYSLRHGAV